MSRQDQPNDSGIRRFPLDHPELEQHAAVAPWAEAVEVPSSSSVVILTALLRREDRSTSLGGQLVAARRGSPAPEVAPDRRKCSDAFPGALLPDPPRLLWTGTVKLR